MRFADKVALVSGAGSGIGKAIAMALGREGARVALLGRSVDKLKETARALPEGRSLLTPARHENEAEAEAAVESCHREFGRLDILINNAGVYLSKTLFETSLEDWTSTLSVNLTGPFVLTRAALPRLREQEGAIVNVSSSLGERPMAGAAAYCAAKAGLDMLTRATALEEAPHGVRVNAVCPGVVDTPIHRQRVGDDPEQVRGFLDQMSGYHPLGRVGTPEEVAALVVFLASEESAWTTGAVMMIDGGISL